MDELEKLKEENEQLRLIIKQLRQQIERYQRQSRRKFNADYDHVPYQERDE